MYRVGHRVSPFTIRLQQESGLTRWPTLYICKGTYNTVTVITEYILWLHTMHRRCDETVAGFPRLSLVQNSDKSRGIRVISVIFFYLKNGAM